MSAEKDDIDKWLIDATPHQIREFFNGISFLKAINVMDQLENKISENAICKIINCLDPSLVESTIIIKKGIQILDLEIKDLEDFISLLEKQHSPPLNIQLWQGQLARARNKKIIYQRSYDIYVRTVFHDINLE